MKKSFVRWCLTAVVISALVSLSGCFPHSTGSTEVGVLVKKFAIFGKRGVEPKYYAPGSTYFFLPIINAWYTLDTKNFNLEMTIDAKKGDRRIADALRFKTIDGNDISLDVIFTYRIIPDSAPYIIQEVAPDDYSLKEYILRTITRSLPRDVFGELKTEDFYKAEARNEKAERTKKLLNKLLNPYGVIMERVSTKDYRFNHEYQKAIEDKKVAEQQALKNRSAANAAIEEYKRKVEEAQGEVNKMRAKADGYFLQSKIEADAYYEKQKRISEAILAEGRAEAKGIRKMNEALSGSGGEVMVKLRLAEALQNKPIYVLPIGGEGSLNLKTTDINRLLETYGLTNITRKANPRVPPPPPPRKKPKK